MDKVKLTINFKSKTFDYLVSDLIQNWSSMVSIEKEGTIFSLLIQYTVCQTIYCCSYSTEIQYETSIHPFPLLLIL